MEVVVKSFASPAEVSNSMPYELSWSTPAKTNADKLWVFWSRHGNELQSLHRSLYPNTGVDTSATGNRTVREKIKAVLRSVKYHLPSVLIQFWAPVRIADKIYLTTADQPFGLENFDTGLCSYRKLCLKSILPLKDVDEMGGEAKQYLGPPTRVFQNGLHEYCPNVSYYLAEEYLLRDRAVEFGVKKYWALPLFEHVTQYCIGVLEIATTISGSYYSVDVVSFASKLQSWRIPKDLETIWKAGQVMERTCWSHQLPFAQMWAASSSAICIGRIFGQYGIHERSQLDLAFSSCRLWDGKGVVGKAFSRRSACFCEDISKLSIDMYPLVPIAREFGLTGCFAVCLRSTQVDDRFFILEFFLPRRGIDYGDPRIFLSMLVATLEREIRSSLDAHVQKLGEKLYIEVIKISSDDELDSFEIGHTMHIEPTNSVFKHPGRIELRHDYQPVDIAHDVRNNISTEQNDVVGPSERYELHNQEGIVQRDSSPHQSVREHDNVNRKRTIATGKQCEIDFSSSRKESKIKTLDIEYGITREILEQHSGKKLQDAADILGVSRSSLKRICRRNEIFRWPPRMLKMPNDTSLIHPDPVDPSKENTEGIEVQNTRTVLDNCSIMVKAVYKDDMIKFQLGLSAKKTDLEEEVAKRLSLSIGSFKMKYLDEEIDWI